VGEVVIDADGVALAGAQDGDGRAVVLLHGLTASRRYVVMGSSALVRAGHRVIAYDARGHGRSAPALAPGEYGYERLCADLAAVLEACGVERAVLAGSSMGAHTLLAFALAHPERVAGVVVITPAYVEGEEREPDRLARWDALAAGLRGGGVEGFLSAYGEPDVPPAWRETVLKVIRQRLALHEHPAAVADAIETVPRSRPFESVQALRAIDVPAAVVASSDEADPGHPQAVGEAYARALRQAELVLDEPGRSPVAWQGSQLSRVIAGVAARARW
jgi:pimeloyl-ACP methyl ester carboxylesterase